MNGGENNVFNLGNGVGFTVKEIIDTAEKVVGKPIKCEMAPRRAGDPAQLVASSEKAKTVLGWKPKYNFDTGIQQTIQWYLDNEDWWKHILSGEYSNYFDNMYGDRLGKDLK